MEKPLTRRVFYVIILTLSLFWIYWSIPPSGGVTSGQIPAPQAGFLAPDFTLATLDGQTTTLSQLRGRPVIINFWASWCPPCRKEMPALEKIYKDYKDQGLVILAVNSSNQDTRENAANFVTQNDLTFLIPLDETGEVNHVYQVQSLPTTFFVDANGIIGGPMAEALLRTRVQQLLEEAR
jgi:cytochrome c biogenesis protein CcmG/thiol:disulfide interchange protein DsbE